MNENIAEILGLLCSEGYYRDYRVDCTTYDKRRKKHYLRKNKRQRVLEFSNKNIPLVYHFQKLLKKEFDYSTKISMTHIDLCRIFITRWDIIDRLISYSDFGCSRWKVPREIIHGNIKVKRSFIRGFFYGDGCLDKTKSN
ncbi:MAG: hypothetical protein KKG75_03785 [Nanoarchaeota archaeon]|nr:hypothetical protein [Nanoarchaeota archaeon]